MEALLAWIERWLSGNPPANVWIGATICNQAEADRDVPKLLRVPAAVRFLSIEPMLGPVNVQWALSRNIAELAAGFLERGSFAPGGETLRRLDWIIAGCESGPHARPWHPVWARSLRDQCATAGVPFLWKQHGEWLPTEFCTDEQAMLPTRKTVYIHPDGSWQDGIEGVDFFGGYEETSWVGKKAAGRLLDGVTHDGYPRVSA